MSEPIPVPTNGGAAFFGFMGVSLALVLASITIITKTSEQHMEQQRLVQGLVVSLFGGLMSL